MTEENINEGMAQVNTALTGLVANEGPCDERGEMIDFAIKMRREDFVQTQDLDREGGEMIRVKEAMLQAFRDSKNVTLGITSAEDIRTSLPNGDLILSTESFGETEKILFGIRVVEETLKNYKEKDGRTDAEAAKKYIEDMTRHFKGRNGAPRVDEQKEENSDLAVI